MTRRLLGAAATALVATAALTGSASAQPLGSFRWQLQPYCNVVTVTVNQDRGIYTLDGYDDQCGATQRAGVVGTAFVDPDGTVGLGFTTVTAPGGVPAQVNAIISVVTGNGTWRGGAGGAGSFVLTPGPSIGGSTKPIVAADCLTVP